MRPRPKDRAGNQRREAKPASLTATLASEGTLEVRDPDGTTIISARIAQAGDARWALLAGSWRLAFTGADGRRGAVDADVASGEARALAIPFE